jgi:ferredoxin
MKRRVRLLLDPTRCDGRGLCAELFPERVRLDRWGFPLVSGDDLPAELVEHARRAALYCPQLALHLIEERR